MFSHKSEIIYYTFMEANSTAIMINGIINQDTVKRSSLMEPFSQKQGTNKFGQKGYEGPAH